MHDNIQKVRERGENLDHLQTKTDNLANQAHGFRRGANRVRKQMWWKDMKMRMCLIAGVIILLLIIIVPSMWNRIFQAGCLHLMCKFTDTFPRSCGHPNQISG